MVMAEARSGTSDRRALLQGLAEALTSISDRLRRLETTKRMIFLLTANAETIAEQARRLGDPRVSGEAASGPALVTQLQALASAYTVLSERVAGEIANERSAAVALAQHARSLLRFVQSPDHAASGSTREESLLALVDGLTALAGREAGDQATVDAIRQLAGRAAALAAEAEALEAHKGSHAMTRASAALYRGLRDIAEETAAVSRRIEDQVTALRSVISGMAASAGQLVAAEAGSGLPPAEDRLRQLVHQGHAAMDW
jgi:hypothetical protein